MQQLGQQCGNETFQSLLIWIVSVLLKHFKKVKAKYCQDIFLAGEKLGFAFEILLQVTLGWKSVLAGIE